MPLSPGTPVRDPFDDDQAVANGEIVPAKHSTELSPDWIQRVNACPWADGTESDDIVRPCLISSLACIP